MRHARATGGTHRRRGRKDGGAALVEFAIIMPILFLLVFGIIEFGWGFFQKLDVRHGAREGSRLAAVNYKTTASPTPADQTTQIINELCDRMDSGSGTTVAMTLISGGAIGGEFTVTVSKPLQQLTGFLGTILNGKTLTSTVDSRLEQTATWASTTSPQSCPP
jgi:Flp pilus assembly protein TadG